MSQNVKCEHDVKSVGIETDEDWERPVRRVIPKLADLEVAAKEAGAELDAAISAANSNEYARDRLNRIYAFVYHAVQTDPEGFAARTKVKVKAGVAYAPYLRPTKHIFNAVLKDRRGAGADIAGGVRNSISRYAKVFAWAGENGVQPEGFLSFLNDNGGIHGVERSYQDAHGSRKNGPNDADKAKLAQVKAAMNSDEDVTRQKSDGSVVITLSADEVRLIRTLLAKQPDDEIVADLLGRLISGLLPVEVAGELPPTAKENARALVLDKAVEWQGGYGSKEWELEWGALLSFTAEELERHSAGIAALEDEGFIAWDDDFTEEGKAQPDYDGWRAFFLPDAAMLYLVDLNRRHLDAVKKAPKATPANINTKPEPSPVAAPAETPEDPNDNPPSGGEAPAPLVINDQPPAYGSVLGSDDNGSPDLSDLGKYAVIVVDPPWDYNGQTQHGKHKTSGSAAKH